MPEASRLQLPLETTLEDETAVRIRFVRPEDKELIRRGLREFSEESLYHRFFTPVITFSDEHLKYLTEVDYRDHCAIGILDISEAEPHGIGLARYIRLKDEPNVAEAAVSIVDAYQGRGAGSLLLAALSQLGAENGINIFRGYLIDDNRRFIRYLSGLGALRQQASGSVVELDLPVYTCLEDIPITPETAKARWAWERLRAAQQTA